MLKAGFLLMPVILASALAGAQVLDTARPNADLQNAFSGSPLTCSQSHTIYVPEVAAERARVKARLLNLLRDSLYDDAKGIVNIAREKEIKKLANKLKNSPPH